MSTLKSTLETLASQFAMSILNALRSASIEEVMGVTGARATAAAAASTAAAPAAKRGPGRPKKAAAAPAAEAPAPAAPKKRGRPAGSGRAASPAAPAPKAAKAPKAKTTSTGRLARRSVDDIGQVLASIVSLVQQHPDGLRAEQIRGALGLDAKELPRPLADGIANGSLTKTGQKRATTYFAGGRGGKKRR